MTFRIGSAPPTGRLPVGVTSYHLVDSSRAGLFATDTSQKCEVALQIWYPAAPSPEAKYLAGSSAFPWGSLICPPVAMAPSDYPQFFEYVAHQVQAKAETRSWPKLMGEVNTHAYPHATPAKIAAPYPVVLFSHGYGGYIAQIAYLMEELASQGYVVVAVGHSQDALLTVFPDGRTIPRNDDHPVFRADNEDWERSQAVFDEIEKSDSPLLLSICRKVSRNLSGR